LKKAAGLLSRNRPKPTSHLRGRRRPACRELSRGGARPQGLRHRPPIRGANRAPWTRSWSATTTVASRKDSRACARRRSMASGCRTATKFIQRDFAEIARNFGCLGLPVDRHRDPPDALDEASCSGLAAVIDVRHRSRGFGAVALDAFSVSLAV